MRLLSYIESIWYSRSVFNWLLWPFSLPFLILVRVKRYCYKMGFIQSNQFSKPVLVVGNITVGGTGKTPFINQLIRFLKANNIKVGLVSRGYGAQTENYPHQITDEDNAITVGDEAFMQFESFKNDSPIKCPMIIDPNRARAVNALINDFDVELVISDDGLQHYKMSRDLEIVLYDASRQFGNQLILPFGPLREPLSRLKTVNHIVQNGQQKTLFTNKMVTIIPTYLVHLKTNKKIPLTDFKNESVNAIAAIGNPQRFYESLKNICKIKKMISFPDHYMFSLNDFKSLNDNKLVMTEKDAVKCFSFAEDNWYYLKVEMEFTQSLKQDLLKSIESLIS